MRKALTKADIAEKLFEDLGLNKREAKEIVEAFFEEIRTALIAAGRDPAALEMIGGIRPRFPNDDLPGDLDEAMAAIPAKLAEGYTSICFKPSQYTDDPAAVPGLCRRVVAAVDACA